MDDHYDVIVCGTGMTECVLSGLLSLQNKKVLHLDRHPYYGGESASLSLSQLCEKFNKTGSNSNLGNPFEYNIDLIPKVIMRTGDLHRILESTICCRYPIEFSLLDAAFVVKDGKIRKVPVTASEALSSNLMGFFQKRKTAQFLKFVSEMTPQAAFNTNYGNLYNLPMSNLFEQFGLSTETKEFIGHAVALYQDDDYLQKPAFQTVMRCKMYYESLGGSGKTPFIYPQYGIGEIAQYFSRLCAVYGGTFMLRAPLTQINFDDTGVFHSILCDGKEITGDMILGDPSYFPAHVKDCGTVVRCIAILDHPIHQLEVAADGCQIIIPTTETKRRSDIYVLQLSSWQQVCPEGKYVVLIGTKVENEASPMEDIMPGLRLISPVLETFVSTFMLHRPLDDGVHSRCFISKSYDPSTHFEETAGDILALHKRITGKEIDFKELQQLSQLN